MKKKDEKGTKVTTPKFRVSFPAVYAPTSYKGGKLLYSLVMLFDKKLVAEGKLKDLQNLIKATKNPEAVRKGGGWCKFCSAYKICSEAKKDIWRGKNYNTVAKAIEDFS